MASASETLIITMIVVYAAALFLFAIEAAYGRRTKLKAGRLMPVGASDTESGGDIEVSVRTTEAEAEAPQSVLGKIALGITGIGFLLSLAQIVARGLAAGRWPWGNMFEFVVAMCLVAVGALLYASWRSQARFLGVCVLVPVLILLGIGLRWLYIDPAPLTLALLYASCRYQARFLGVFVLVPVLILLGIGVRWLYIDPGPLIPALQSYWIPIHVSATILAGGAFMVSGAAGITYLISHRTESKRASGEKVTGVAGNLPSPELLDRISHRMVLFAFPRGAFGVIAGPIAADESWRRVR